MKRVALAAALILLARILHPFPATAGVGMENSAIDLERTAKLVQDWTGRSSFPESTTFAFHYAYSLVALGEPLRPAAKAKAIDFLRKCQDSSGGFTAEPTYGKTPNVIFTYNALMAASLFDALDRIDMHKAADFILALGGEDGGIAATKKAGERATLATTYYGVESLHLLGLLDRLESVKTTAFVAAYRDKNRGFSMIRGGNSSPQATYMAIRSLHLLGALTDEIKADAIAYLKTTRYSGLVKDKEFTGLPQIQAMAYTLEALGMLSALEQADTTRIHDFVASLYVPDNGGFGPRPGLGTTPPSTYHAIVCLVRLGKLRDPLTTADAKPGSPSKPGATAPPP
ncbi:MAG: terpene cyclase/mutase family protein [Nitrospirota bacterium]|jgi:prenyltransferase beta subunit